MYDIKLKYKVKGTEMFGFRVKQMWRSKVSFYSEMQGKSSFCV